MPSDNLTGASIRDVVDLATGERLENQIVIPAETYWANKEKSRKARLNKNKKSNRGFFKRNADKLLGNFVGIYFNVGEVLAPTLSPQDLFRLLYFSTFLGYDGLLHSTQRSIMTINELKEVSGLKDGTWKNTITALLAAGYMTLGNEGIQINPNFAVRGTMVQNPSSEIDIRFRRVSIKGIQSIYNSLEVSEHVVAGYILKILPYMNDCNILCYNPLSTDIGDVDIMTDMDFCNEVGLSTDKSNVRKFMKKVYCIGEGASDMPLLQKLHCDIYKKDVLFINMFVIGFAHSDDSNQDVVMNWLSGVKFCNYNDTESALSKGFQEYMKGRILNADNASNSAPIDGLTAIANQ